MPAVTVPLVALTEATPRSRLLVLDLTGTGFTFRPGQAVMVGNAGQQVRRPYSIACSPEQAAASGALELLVGVDAAGSIGPHLAGVATGTAIALDGPLGEFTFPETGLRDHLLFVAGGTGIAPLRSMVDHAMRTHPDAKISLLFSARRADEFAFIAELQEHARAGRLELRQTVTRGDGEWQGERGRIGRRHYEAVLHEPRRTLCFVCGPPSMVSESIATLGELGVDREAIRTEQWTAKS